MRNSLRRGRGNYFGPDEYEVLNKPRVSLQTTGAQAASGVAAATIWDTVLYDTDGMWASTSPTRITARTAGTYLFTAMLGFTANAAGYRQIFFALNGVNSFFANTVFYDTAGVSSNANISWQLALNRDDYVELRFASSVGVNTVAATTNTGLQACLISTI